MTTSQYRDSLDALEDKIEYLLKFVTIISELVLLLGLAYAGFKLAHRGPTPETLDQIWLVSQVLALDLSAPGLFAMATRAREQGNERRAKWAIRIAIVLIIMSILTMVEGAVTSYLPNIPQSVILWVTLFMMIIRAGAAVGYSVFRRLHKAANSAPIPAPIVPAITPELSAQLEERDVQIERLFQRISTLEMQAIAPPIAPPIAPVLSTEPAQIAPEIEDNSGPNPDEIESQLEPQLEPELEGELPANVTPFHTRIEPRITEKLPAISAPNVASNESKKGPYVVTKLEAVERLNCSLQEIERGIREGIIQPYGRDPENKVLVSSLDKFTPSKRGRRKAR